jgi:peptidyl-tRNA hydrolase, PTH1 family
MKLILGIGNYGDIYEDTRHNSGYQAIDIFASDCNIDIRKKDFKSIYGKGKVFDEDVILLKPLTYVNLSGEALVAAKNFYKINVEDIIVLVDDMDTEPGNVRLKKKGSSAGHNGLKNIIQLLGTEEFKRIRIGIGRPAASNNPNRIPDWVLSCPKDSDIYTAWKDGISKGAEALEYTLRYGFEKAMTKYNSEDYVMKKKEESFIKLKVTK